jgi:uncharacterized membrane protein
MDDSPATKVPQKPPRWLQFVLPAAALGLLVTWLILTPDGLLGKMDAIGCAVCHRMEQRSFFLGARPLPLCARCTGLFLGALIGLLYQSRLNQHSGLPPCRFLFLFGAFLLFYAFDGANSYLNLIMPSLYEPNNALRLSSGLLLGIGVSALLLPVMRQALLVEIDPAPILDSWKHLAAMLAIGGAVLLLMYSDNPFVLYPLAILSALSVWVLLGSAYTIILQVLLPRAVAYSSYREAWLPLLGGFSIALVQILVTDLLRLALTGNWNGLIIPT